MLKASNRLKKTTDFKTVFQTGRRFRFGPVTIISAPNSLAEQRFGVVVSAKVAKNAVTRNKVRRQLSHLLRLALTGLQEKAKRDTIVLVTSLPKEDNFKQFEEALHEWQKRLS